MKRHRVRTAALPCIDCGLRRSARQSARLSAPQEGNRHSAGRRRPPTGRSALLPTHPQGDIISVLSRRLGGAN
jgi:hypothetical protein